MSFTIMGRGVWVGECALGYMTRYVNISLDWFFHLIAVFSIRTTSEELDTSEQARSRVYKECGTMMRRIGYGVISSLRGIFC